MVANLTGRYQNVGGTIGVSRDDGTSLLINKVLVRNGLIVVINDWDQTGRFSAVEGFCVNQIELDESTGAWIDHDCVTKQFDSVRCRIANFGALAACGQDSQGATRLRRIDGVAYCSRGVECVCIGRVKRDWHITDRYARTKDAVKFELQLSGAVIQHKEISIDQVDTSLRDQRYG